MATFFCPEKQDFLLSQNDYLETARYIGYSKIRFADDTIMKMIKEACEKLLEVIKPQAVFEEFDYEMKYLRPPKGEFSQRTLAITKKLGYTTVMWSFAYDDWEESKQGREEYARNKILSNTHNGEVMLLHANSKDNCNILDSIIKEIKKCGYEFKTLDEFLK